MKTAHTPGPWMHYDVFGGTRDRVIAVESRQVIAKVAGHSDERKTNARLIAAAPDMLQLLRDAYSVIATQIENGEDTVIAASIREVVAKVIA